MWRGSVQSTSATEPPLPPYHHQNGTGTRGSAGQRDRAGRLAGEGSGPGRDRGHTGPDRASTAPAGGSGTAHASRSTETVHARNTTVNGGMCRYVSAYLRGGLPRRRVPCRGSCPLGLTTAHAASMSARRCRRSTSCRKSGRLIHLATVSSCTPKTGAISLGRHPLTLNLAASRILIDNDISLLSHGLGKVRACPTILRQTLTPTPRPCQYSISPSPKNINIPDNSPIITQ